MLYYFYNQKGEKYYGNNFINVVCSGGGGGNHFAMHIPGEMVSENNANRHSMRFTSAVEVDYYAVFSAHCANGSEKVI